MPGGNKNATHTKKAVSPIQVVKNKKQSLQLFQNPRPGSDMVTEIWIVG